MYGTSDVKADAGRPNFMAGISDNVELTKVAYENSKEDGSGKDVLSFTFTAPNGGTFRKIFWEVDAAKVSKYNQQNPKNHGRDNEKLGYKKGEKITDDQAVQMAFNEFNRHIKHIMTKYMTEEEATIQSASSYKDFSTQVASRLSSKIGGKKMRLKTIYNGNGYMDLPKFGNYLESMSVENTKLSIDPVWDKVKKPTPTDESTVSAAVSTSTAGNDLPF